MHVCSHHFDSHMEMRCMTTAFRLLVKIKSTNDRMIASTKLDFMFSDVNIQNHIHVKDLHYFHDLKGKLFSRPYRRKKTNEQEERLS